MGSRRRSSSRSTTNSGSAGGNMDQAMQKLPPVSAKDSGNMYNSMLGGQLGIIGELLGPLIQGGQQMMQSNPGLANFMANTGQQVQQMEQPQWLTDFSAAAKGLGQQMNTQAAQPPAVEPKQPPYFSRLSPEQQAALLKFQRYGGYGRR